MVYIRDIPVVILCGGTGTRLKEQTEFIPKPMVPIGGKPMLWHIMKYYSHYGFRKFILALGYKQEVIKDYFLHFDSINNDIEVNVNVGRGSGLPAPYILRESTESWTVTLSDTGQYTMKGGRLSRIQKYISSDIFMMTYGDGIGNVNLKTLLKYHMAYNKIATVTGIHPISRFGEINHDGGLVTWFSEKPKKDGCLINGGFFVFNKRIFNYLNDAENCDLEVGPLERLAQDRELMVYKHDGFWKCMDTLNEMIELDNMWREGKAKWKIW